MNNTENYLFKTNAIRFAKSDKPFWYTSGKIGPYFINTHFIYGSEESAVKFLSFIDLCLKQKNTLPKKLFDEVYSNYLNNSIYMSVIDEMKEKIISDIGIDNFDYISGGERRDWFFSIILAHLLNKPHISIFKDLSTVVSDSNFEIIDTPNLKDKRVLHIADLITVASSYKRYWLPAIENLGAKITNSMVVVDRMQGGEELLNTLKIKSHSMTKVDPSLFNIAYKQGLIDNSMLNFLNNFFKKPDETMKNFLINTPKFLEDALASDEKTVSRARLLIDNDLYNLKK